MGRIRSNVGGDAGWRANGYGETHQLRPRGYRAFIRNVKGERRTRILPSFFFFVYLSFSKDSSSLWILGSLETKILKLKLEPDENREFLKMF